MATQNNQLFKQIFNSLADEDKQKFIEVLDQQESEEQKNILVNRLLDSYNKANKEQIIAGRQAALKPDPMFGPISVLPEALAREEAAFANPALQVGKQLRGAVLGQEQSPSVSPVEAFQQGLQGETMSPYRQGQEVSLGDAAQSLGVPAPLAPAAGFIASQFLPSSLLTLGAGRLAVNTSKAVYEKAVKGLVGSVDASDTAKIEPLLRNVFRLTQLKANANVRATAGIIGKFSGLHPDYIVSAIENPKWLNFKYAGKEKVGDFASTLRKKFIEKRTLSPSLFGPSPEDIDMAADNVVKSFNGLLDKHGTAIKAASKGETRTTKADVLHNLINLNRKAFGVIDEAGNFRGVARGEALDDFFDGVVGKINALAGENGGDLTADNLRELNKIIRNEVSKKQVLGPNGIVMPMGDVDAAATKLRGQLSHLFHSTYKDNEELISNYDAYAHLSGLRGEASTIFKSKDKLAEFIRNFDTKSPTAQNKLNSILAELPDGHILKDQIESALNSKANTIVETMPFLSSRNENEIERGLKDFMTRNFEDWTDSESQKFIALSKELGFDVDDLIKNKVSSEFKKTLNLFKVYATATLVGSAVGYGLGGVTGAGSGLGTGIGGAIGFGLSSPRTIATSIKFFDAYKQMKLTQAAKTAGAIKRTVAPNLAAATFRKFVENMGDNNG